MYGSKSDKARLSKAEKSEAAYWKSYNRKPEPLDDIDEQITAMVEPDEPAALTFSQNHINRLHAEALKMHDEWWMDLLDREHARIEMEDYEARDAEYDEAYGGYSDDPDDGDHSGCWIPFMRLPELRDTFGENWLGNGFHIVQGNGMRAR